MHRPTSVVVMAILAIAFGALGFCSLPLSWPILVLDASAPAQDPAHRPFVEHPGFLLYTKVAVVAGVCASAALLTAGIGMLALRPWARTLALVHACFGLVATPVGVVLTAVYYVPGVVAMTDQPAAYAIGAKIGAIGALVLTAAFGLALPIVTLVVLTRPAARAAFARPASPSRVAASGPSAASRPPAATTDVPPLA
jgi:hypothetical protein